MYTIEDLKNGKCAVINDGTVVELKRVLLAAEWPPELINIYAAYHFSIGPLHYYTSTKPPIPTQSVKDFVKQLDEENKSSEIKSLHEEKDPEEEFTFSEDDIPSDFPYHPYVLDQGIQERCRESHVSPKEAFDYCVQHNVDHWFTWHDSTQEYVYWEHIYHNYNFIPANYTPKYFKSRQSKLPLSRIPLCGVIDPEYQPSNLTKEKKDFMIPASYMEVELTIKKPICKF